MTYDAGTDSITTEDNLNPAEQEALKVGEQMQAEQEQLLAGKYKNAEDLEKAYVELQKKLGENSDEVSETTGDSESNESEETSEETEETKEDSTATTIINEAAAEYWDNNQELSEETIGKLSSMDSKDLLSAYLAAQKANPVEQAPEVDLSDRDIASVQDVAGGADDYNNLVEWASSNLSQSEVKSFDDLISSGNVGAIKLAVSGLKAQYDNANGYEGRMLTGKPPQTSKDVFRSQPELVAAMSDPRYDKDPAYRQDVIEKLDRSGLNF